LEEHHSALVGQLRVSERSLFVTKDVIECDKNKRNTRRAKVQENVERSLCGARRVLEVSGDNGKRNAVLNGTVAEDSNGVQTDALAKAAAELNPSPRKASRYTLQMLAGLSGLDEKQVQELCPDVPDDSELEAPEGNGFAGSLGPSWMDGRRLDTSEKAVAGHASVLKTLRWRATAVRKKVVRTDRDIQVRLSGQARREVETKLEQAKTNHIVTSDQLDQVKNYIADLHNSCDFIVANFEVRREARTAETESLKNAKAVLSGAAYN
jgi:hypothetical protein